MKTEFREENQGSLGDRFELYQPHTQAPVPTTISMSLMILLVLICSTKVSEKSDMAKSWAIFCCPGTYKNS